MYNQKIIFNELECKQILSEFVENNHVAYKIRYDGVFYEKGCSATSHDLKWDSNNKWIFNKIKNWTDELNLGLKWKKPPSASFRKYKKGDFFLKHTDDVKGDYVRSERGIRILTIGIQLNDKLDYFGGDFFVWDNSNKIHIGKSLGNCALYTTNMPHEVTEITEGERNSLILFITDMHATFTKSII
jgi:predicted 2-oxoglutarate/Fe(II)-dependent dioxygenase YbiX